MPESEKGKLKRVIGTWELGLNLINIIIGAGIFVLPAIVAAGLGSASILAYLFCGFLITLVMLCFAEAGTYVTSTGGAYAYIQQSFGKYFGFLTSIFFVVAVISANAAVANAIADILGSMVPWFQNTAVRMVFFFLLFSGFAYINIIGVKQGIGFVKFITAAKLIPLLLIIFFGFGDVDSTNLVWEKTPSIKDIGEMSLILFFAFQGAESGLSVSGEVRNPKKTIPRAIFLGILIVLIVYILIQTVSQGILGGTLPQFEENPLGEVAGKIFGPVGFTLVTVGAAVSMFGNIGGTVLSIPRVIYGAAKDNVIPVPKLAAVHSKFATPHIAIIAYAVLGFALASLGGFKQLAILASSAILLIYLGVALSVIKLRISLKQEQKKDAFVLPGGPTIPIISALVIVWFLSNLPLSELKSVGVFILIISALYGLVNLWRQMRR